MIRYIFFIAVVFVFSINISHSKILNYDCYEKKEATQTIWTTSHKRSVDTEKKIMIIEANYTYKPLFKKIRYHSFRDEIKIEIDDQKIIWIK